MNHFHSFFCANVHEQCENIWESEASEFILAIFMFALERTYIFRNKYMSVDELAFELW